RRSALVLGAALPAIAVLDRSRDAAGLEERQAHARLDVHRDLVGPVALPALAHVVAHRMVLPVLAQLLGGVRERLRVAIDHAADRVEGQRGVREVAVAGRESREALHALREITAERAEALVDLPVDGEVARAL